SALTLSLSPGGGEGARRAGEGNSSNTRVKNLGDVWMVHQRERLAFALETGDHGFGVHAQLDDFERDTAADWFLLLGHVHDSAAPFADLLKQFVVANTITRFFSDCRAENHG